MSRDSPISADFTYACAFQRIALLSSQAERELSARIDTKKKDRFNQEDPLVLYV